MATLAPNLETSRGAGNLLRRNDPRTRRPRAWVNLGPFGCRHDGLGRKWNRRPPRSPTSWPVMRRISRPQDQTEQWDDPHEAGTCGWVLRAIGHRFGRQVPQPGERLRRRARLFPVIGSATVAHRHDLAAPNRGCHRDCPDPFPQPGFKAITGSRQAGKWPAR